MTIDLKFKLLRILLKIIIYLATSAVFFLTMENPKLTIIFPVSIAAAFVMTPRFTKVKMQSGNKTQVKWIFMKRAILV